ncbi:MAG TPA: DUF1800 domain-containing protein [Opitutaceae bacterium]
MPTLPPLSEAWQPLPPAAWDSAAARHLLRRAGWTARPADVARAQQDGLEATLARLFPETPALLAKPASITQLESELPALTEQTRSATGPERQRLQKDLRERAASTLQDLSLAWLDHASTAGHEAAAKWTAFLSDIYVVSQEKVKQTGLIYAHQDILIRHGLGRAPALTKAISRSPAMIVYLDLQDSRRDAPNENFARELFELFTLGEGNYSEADIKEAARAFTGYRQRLGEVRVAPQQADKGSKTIFGRSGRFDGDDVIDLVYEQPAAATFLPRELVRFYLTDTALPADYLTALGDAWRRSNFDLRRLALQFFGSRLFFASEFRGTLIKSPLQFYLGLIQDLDLQIAPLPRQVLGPLRQMGQMLYQPPNVRGWVGGRSWINSSTFAARRQVVQGFFSPLNEALLNADDVRALNAARATGRTRFVVSDAMLTDFAALTPAEFATRVAAQFLPVSVDAAYLEAIRDFATADGNARSTDRVRAAIAAILQSPEYQLC